MLKVVIDTSEEPVTAGCSMLLSQKAMLFSCLFEIFSGAEVI
jgi:hypothetical protein